MDLEKFFDRDNHDILMSRLARRVKDRGVLGLVRRYLQAGVMDGGLVTRSTEGTPQGGPLSPLLSNILLDDLDKELERRGHAFCRYADDCNIYVRSLRAGAEEGLSRGARGEAIGTFWARATLAVGRTPERGRVRPSGTLTCGAIQSQAQDTVPSGPRP